MKLLFSSAVIAILAFFGSTSLAHVPENGRVHGTVVRHWFKTHAPDHGQDYPFHEGFGLIADADLDENGGVELSLLHIDKIFSVQTDKGVYAESTTRMYIASGYRHWFRPYVSAAAAFFSSYTMGEPKIIVGNSQNQTPTSASDATEYGLDFSLQFEPTELRPSPARISAIIDVRYSYSLTPKAGERSNHYGFLVGIKYRIQDRGTPLD